MRALLLALLLALALVLHGTALAGGSSRVAAARTVAWAGVDYTRTRFVGSSDFRDEQQVVGYYPAVWNELVLEELLGKMSGGLHMKVRVDVDGMMHHNEACTAEQIIRGVESTRETHLSEADLAALVASYELEVSEGVALAIVMDRLVKLEEKGCGWVVFFDAADRKLLHYERLCEAAAGFGFRNYWFRPVKTILTRDLELVTRRAKRAR